MKNMTDQEFKEEDKITNCSLSMFDSVSQANEGAELHLCLPASDELAYNDGKPLTITLRGSDSDVFALEMQRRLQLSAKNQKKGKEDEEIDIKKATRESCRFLAKMTIGWAGIPSADGKKLLPFSEAEAEVLYLKYKDIRLQVDKFIGSRVNFIKA